MMSSRKDTLLIFGMVGGRGSEVGEGGRGKEGGREGGREGEREGEIRRE